MSPRQRRIANIAFFAAIIVAAALLYPRLWSRRPPPSVSPAPVVPAPPPPRLVVPPPRPDVAPDVVVAAKPSEEQALLSQMRALVKSAPARAEALARESRRRFPDGASADERDALLVDALINQQRIGAARDETYYYLDLHPQGRFAEHLFIMTGVRPTPRRNAR